MARMSRAEVFSSSEVAVIHVMNRVVRRCFLMGDDPISGKNFDHRKVWIERYLQQFSGCFAIDLLGFAIMSNHFHLILRSRPDVVQTWSDQEVAKRWLLLCPVRKDQEGNALPPNEFEVNMIVNDQQKLETIRLRLSDIAWWMRLLCQHIAVRANHEDKEVGKFWQSRYRAVRLLDETALLACAAYVDLNPIRAAQAQTLEQSDHTSVQRRIQTPQGDKQESARKSAATVVASKDTKTAHASKTEPIKGVPSKPDRFLSPISLDERTTQPGPNPNKEGNRCSDKGFLPMSREQYLSLLDWTARQYRKDKVGRTPDRLKPIFERLGFEPTTWCRFVREFGQMFKAVAGRPKTIDETRSRVHQRRFRIAKATRELLTVD